MGWSTKYGFLYRGQVVRSFLLEKKGSVHKARVFVPGSGNSVVSVGKKKGSFHKARVCFLPGQVARPFLCETILGWSTKHVFVLASLCFCGNRHRAGHCRESSHRICFYWVRRLGRFEEHTHRMYLLTSLAIHTTRTCWRYLPYTSHAPADITYHTQRVLYWTLALWVRTPQKTAFLTDFRMFTNDAIEVRRPR